MRMNTLANNTGHVTLLVGNRAQYAALTATPLQSVLASSCCGG